MQKSKLNIFAIKTNSGWYLSDSQNSEYNSTRLIYYMINGETPSKTFHKNWVKVTSKPEKIEIEEGQPDINYRFELIDKSMETDKIKDCFKRESVAFYDDDERVWLWKDEFKHLSSLYKLVSDKQPNILSEVDFDLNVILEIDEIKEHGLFSYKIKDDYSKDSEITNDSIQHQLIDKIVYPEIILPERPCKLTSKESYQIIREYVKNNIDPKVAEVSSDYNFCFSVNKKIELSEPLSYKVDINAFSQRKKKTKIETKWRTHRTVQIFEMTNDVDKYKGYTPIEGFSGKNQTDLKEKIDKYLKCLIEYINVPVKDCPNCKGLGVIFDRKFEYDEKNN